MKTTLTYSGSKTSVISSEIVDMNTAKTVYKYGHSEIAVTSIFDGAQKWESAIKSIAFDNLSSMDLNPSEQEVRQMNKTVVAALYCRLSKDDKDGNNDSVSIENQRYALQDFVVQNGFQVYDIYVDDGYSGTNFERPAFQRMMDDVHAGKVNCVITRDLRRFGRNYVKFGEYVEDIFVRKEIRYISIMESVDTINGITLLMSIINLLNEMVPQQTSMKVRQVMKLGAKQGKFMNSHAPFGYVKDPANKHKLIIDAEAAEVVRHIFCDYACGKSARMIADELNLKRCDTPSFYRYKKHGKPKPRADFKNEWCCGTVSQILRNQVYIGNMVHGKREVISYKIKKRRKIPIEDWIVVEGTHECIVENDTWKRVQQLIDGKTKIRRTKTETIGLFSGRIKCADCGSPLAFSRKKLKNAEKGIYRCSKYNNNGSSVCSAHYVEEDFIVMAVLNDVRHYAVLAANEKQSLTDELLSMMNVARDSKCKNFDREIVMCEGRIKIISDSIKSLYEDKVSGAVPLEVFQNLLTDYVSEDTELKEKLASVIQRKEHMSAAETEVENWLSLIGHFTTIEKLDRKIVGELIDSILVSQATKEGGKRKQNITIRYRFISDLLDARKKDIA